MTCVSTLMCLILLLYSCVRTSPRTQGCKVYAEELLLQPNSSNFTSHLEHQCKRFPADESYEKWLELRESQRVSVASSVGHVPATSGLAAQRDMMRVFGERGRESPERNVTKSGFRECFVMALVEDDLSFSTGEKRGMRRCLTYILPKDYKIPTRMMVQRDVELLYRAMEMRLIKMIEVI